MTCRATYRWLMTLLLATCALIGGPNYAAETTELKAKQIWQLLDYVAVDYGGAVANGAVLKASEYAEMQEFAARGRLRKRKIKHAKPPPAFRSARPTIPARAAPCSVGSRCPPGTPAAAARAV